MTLQESARTKAAWAAKVVSLFVFVGGAVGGAAVGVVMLALVLASSINHTSEIFLRIPVGLLMASCVGLIVGFPAAVVTGAALVGARGLRRRWRLTGFAITVSALWGVLFAGLLRPSPPQLESYFWFAATFALAGAIATLVCFALLSCWRLQSPS